jgi:hypothetical protein
MTRIALMALAVFTAACATAQPAPPPPFDPVGVYDFSTSVDGTTVPGTITFRRSAEGTLTAVLSTAVTGEIQIRTVTLDDRRMELRSNIEGETLLMRLDFLEDGRITGGWEIGSGSGAVTGVRRGS